MNTEARVRRLFEGVLDDGTPWRHQNAPFIIVEIKGRCAHVRLSGEPCWRDLALDFLGPGPCESFRLDGRDLWVRMKTAEQTAADDAAGAFDEKHGEFETCDFPDVETAPPVKARKPSKERRRGPLYTAIADQIEASGQTTFIRADLLADVQQALERDGREVRADNLARTLKTQIVGTLLEVVPDSDGEELQLKDSGE